MERSATGNRSAAFLAASLAGCGLLIQASQLFPAVANSASISLEYEAGVVTLQARETTLLTVLGELARAAGFRVVVGERFVDRGPMNLVLSQVTLEQALRRLLVDSNNIVFYAEGGGNIAQVWLLAADRSPPPAASSPADTGAGSSDTPGTGASRANSVLRLANRAQSAGADAHLVSEIQTRLIEILGSDPDALVRTRAALALGKLGTDRAVAALELATRDIEPAVSAQSINALGGIGSILAIHALGAILADVERPVRSRVIAAQALWKHDHELAREYLAAAAADNDDRVRQSASAAPPPIPAPANRIERGGAQLE